MSASTHDRSSDCTTVRRIRSATRPAVAETRHRPVAGVTLYGNVVAGLTVMARTTACGLSAGRRARDGARASVRDGVASSPHVGRRRELGRSAPRDGPRRVGRRARGRVDRPRGPPGRSRGRDRRPHPPAPRPREPPRGPAREPGDPAGARRDARLRAAPGDRRRGAARTASPRQARPAARDHRLRRLPAQPPVRRPAPDDARHRVRPRATPRSCSPAEATTAPPAQRRSTTSAAPSSPPTRRRRRTSRCRGRRSSGTARSTTSSRFATLRACWHRSRARASCGKERDGEGPHPACGRMRARPCACASRRRLSSRCRSSRAGGRARAGRP